MTKPQVTDRGALQYKGGEFALLKFLTRTFTDATILFDTISLLQNANSCNWIDGYDGVDIRNTCAIRPLSKYEAMRIPLSEKKKKNTESTPLYSSVQNI